MAKGVVLNGVYTENPPGGSPQAPGGKPKPRKEYTVLTTLGQYPDALYLSAKYELPENLRELLTAAKLKAQETEEGLVVLGAVKGLPGGPLYVKRHGRGKYQFILENADVYAEITTWKNLPTVQIQFKAHMLYEFGLSACEKLSYRLLRSFGAPKGTEPKVTRFDLCTDFQPSSGWRPPEMPDVVTRARSRYVNFKGSKINAVTLGERSGALQVQIYNKSNEILVSGKTWMYDVWRASGNYQEGVPVWRVEVRFFRLGLHQFDINTVRELLASIGDLALYSVGSDAPWVRVCEPETRHYSDNNNSGRREPAEWWLVVIGAMRSGLSSSGRKRRRPRLGSSFARAVKMAGAYMAKASAIARASGLAHHMTPGDAGQWVGQIVQDQLWSSGRTWADVINVKMSGLRLEYTDDRPMMADPVSFASYPMAAMTAETSRRRSEWVSRGLSGGAPGKLFCIEGVALKRGGAYA